MYEEFLNHDIKVYAGYVKDESELVKSSSGGIATAMAKYIINNGGYVAGVKYTDDFYGAEYIVTNNPADIEKLRGSKYIEAEKNNVFNKVLELLKDGKTVLFFGLPCVVAGINKFCAEFKENLITCELICHGPTVPEVQREYVKYLEKKFKSKVIGFSSRFKKEGWHPPYLHVKLENGKEFTEKFTGTHYGKAINIMGIERCYDCKFKGNNRTGDITLGDFWGAAKDDEFWNENGVSVILAETEKGNKFINNIDNITLFESDFERAVKHNPMLIKSKTKRKLYDKFKKDFEKFGLIKAVNKNIGFKEKIKKNIKKIVMKIIK